MDAPASGTQASQPGQNASGDPSQSQANTAATSSGTGIATGSPTANALAVLGRTGASSGAPVSESKGNGTRKSELTSKFRQIVSQRGTGQRQTLVGRATQNAPTSAGSATRQAASAAGASATAAAASNANHTSQDSQTAAAAGQDATQTAAQTAAAQAATQVVLVAAHSHASADTSTQATTATVPLEASPIESGLTHGTSAELAGAAAEQAPAEAGAAQPANPTSLVSTAGAHAAGHIAVQASAGEGQAWSTTAIVTGQSAAAVATTAETIVAATVATTTAATEETGATSSDSTSSDSAAVAEATASPTAATPSQPSTTTATPTVVAAGPTPSTSASGSPALGNTADGSDGTATSGVDRVRFVQRVARAFQSVGTNGGSVRLRLSPPELGSVKLEVSLKNGVLTAHAQTETSQARDALVENLPALRERLAEQNVQVDQFDVDLFDSSSGGTPNQSQAGDDGSPGFVPAAVRSAGNPTTSTSGVAATAAPQATGIVNGGLNVVI